MSRRIVAVLVFLLVFSYSLKPEEKTSLIGDIGIIDSPQFKGPRPPARLSVAVEMVEGSYYKLKDNDNVISAGLLRKGFNVIPIESDRLFEKSGLYEYELELKADGGIVLRKIEIRIHLETEDETKTAKVMPKPRVLDREYGLAMYIDGEKMAFSMKKHYEKFPLKLKMPDMPQGHMPFDPNTRDNPMVNSFPILGAAALAYKLFRDITQKDTKKSIEDPVRFWKQRTASYFRTDPKGIIKEIKTVITIRLKDS